MTSPIGEPAAEQTAGELRRWQALFDRLPAVVAFWDSDLRNVLANAAYLEWFGLTPEQMRGMHAREVLGEEGWTLTRDHLHAALAGEEQNFERTITTPAGEAKHALVSYVPERADGEVIGFYVMAADITEQVEARRDLLEAERLAGMGSYTFRPPNQVDFSPELLRIMGRDPAEGSPSLDDYLRMVHPDDMPDVNAALERADQGLAYEVSYRIVRDDGSVRRVRSRTRRVLDSNGQLLLLRGVMQDETTAHQLSDRLERTNGLLADLIAMLGHDLRQPIAVVRGYLEQAEEDWETLSDEHRLSYIRSASRAANRMDGLLHDILMLVNLDTGALVSRPSRIHLPTLLEELAEAAPYTVKLESSGDVFADADPVHVRQIVANLLSNAGRYGRSPYQLRIGTERSSEAGHDVATIALTDHGEGVPPEFVPRLFDRFSRASSGIATTVGGTGFGLYIVRQLARANHGDIEYAPNDPQGSTFTLRLPLA